MASSAGRSQRSVHLKHRTSNIMCYPHIFYACLVANVILSAPFSVQISAITVPKAVILTQ